MTRSGWVRAGVSPEQGFDHLVDGPGGSRRAPTVVSRAAGVAGEGGAQPPGGGCGGSWTPDTSSGPPEEGRRAPIGGEQGVRSASPPSGASRWTGRAVSGRVPGALEAARGPGAWRRAAGGDAVPRCSTEQHRGKVTVPGRLSFWNTRSVPTRRVQPH